MKHYVFTIAFYVFLISNGLVFGQISIKNPEITPLSPEAASMARYGDLDLTSATGQMRYSIPIYTIDVDGHSWPIALNYNYGGLILEGKPSLSGLGWQLSGYASITKEARGLPDGHPEGYYGDQGVENHVNLAVNDYLDNGTFDQISFHDLAKFRDGYWDSEVDKYTLSVNGETIGFKVIKDDNGNMDIYYLSRHNYKIEAFKDITQVFEVASFEVTDDKGVKYIFNAEHRERVNEDPAMFTKFWGDRTTAWMLSEIQYGNGQSIVFNYEADQNYVSYNFSATGYENDLNISTTGQNEVDVPVQNWSIGYDEKVHEVWMTRMILSSIEFPKGKIELETTTTGRTLFTDLVLKDHNNSIVDEYEFTYMGARDALINIQKNDERFYAFQYYGVNGGGLPVPSFFDDDIKKPYDQDYWKYYNNANNSRAIHLPFDGEYANKLPNFSATRVGALKRITYATGGYTEIDYEQNTVKVPYENSPGANHFNPNQEEILRLHAKLDNNERTASATLTFDYPMRAVLYHKIRGNVIHGNSIWMDIQRNSGPDLTSYYNSSYWNGANAVALSQPYYPIIMDHARNYILEDEDNPYYPYPIVAPQLLIALDPDNNCPWYNGNGEVVGGPDENSPGGQTNGSNGGSIFSNFCVSETEIDMLDDSGGVFWIAPGTYTFSIQVGTDYWPLAYDDIFAEIGIRWEDPALDNGGELPEFMNKYVGGIRVKSTVDYTREDDYTGAKNYDYNDDDGFSTARLNQTPYTKNEHLWHHTDPEHNPTQWTQKLDEYLLNSYSAANLNHGIPVYYSRVKTFKTAAPHSGSSSSYGITPNGYVIQEYFLPAETLTDIYPAIPLGQDVTKAVPSVKYVRDVTQQNVSTETVDYSQYRWHYITQHPITQEPTHWDENPEHPWSFKYYKKLVNRVYWNQNGCDYDFDAPNDPCLKALHDIKLYKEVDSKRLANEVVSQYSGVTTKKSFTYDTKLLLQEEETSVQDVVALDKVRVEYDYPYEMTETPYQNMHNYSNQINTVVAQRTYKEDVLTSQSKVDFMPSNGYYRPKDMFSAKGSHPLQKEIEFDYDAYGNILSYVNHDGASVPTTFVWGYDKTLPVAKLVNATPQEVNALINQTTIQSLDGADLENALDVLRTQLPNAQVTTYTYNPLIGVASVTDPLGQTLYYTYDDANRLKLVKDKNQKVIEAYEFQYRLNPITATLLTTSEELFLTQHMICNVGVQGGSGNFSYAWTVSNESTGTVLLQDNTTNMLSIGPATAAYAPSIKITCVVTDTQINESITVERTIAAHNSYAPLTVNNISKAGTPNVGNTMQFTIGASGGSGIYSYHWRKVNSNGIETDFGVSDQTLISDQIIASDCNSYTIYCLVTDLTSGATVNKSIEVTIASGCPNGNN